MTSLKTPINFFFNRPPNVSVYIQSLNGTKKIPQLPLGVRVPVLHTGATHTRLREFEAGRQCAAISLSSLGATEVNVGINKDGSPAWPHSFVGSITHNETTAAAAVASAVHFTGIGIDIESVMSPDVADDILEYITGEEKALVRALPVNLCTALTILFSSKESALKALWPMLNNVTIDDIKIEYIDCYQGSFMFRLASRACTSDQTSFLRGHIAYDSHVVHSSSYIPNPSVGSHD